MYTGIVTNVHWERVYLTIEGTITRIDDKDEQERIFRKRHPSFRDETRAGDPSRWIMKSEELERRFYDRMEELKHRIGKSYDPDKPYILLHTEGYMQTYLMDPEIDEKTGKFSICLNVTLFNGREQMPDAVLNLSVFHGGIDHVMNISAEIMAHSFEYARPFTFNKVQNCYVVSIRSTSDETDALFQLHSFLFERKRHRKFDIRRILREGKDTLIKSMIKLYYLILYTVVPHKGKRILFSTESRGNLQGNLKAVYDGMKRRRLDKEYKIYTSFRSAAGGHSSVLSCIKVITYMAIADKVLIDDYAPLLAWLKIRPKTKVIQLWHAGVGFKSVGFCRFGANGTPKLENPHRQYDFAIAGSTSLRRIYSEVFGIEEENILPTGLPRIDAVLDKKENDRRIKDFYSEHPELRGKKLIIFAPTFRGMGAKTAFYPYEKLDLKRIYDMCGDEYVFIFKMHPFIQDRVEIPDEYKNRIVDFTGIGDVNDLLPVIDIMITDYSSIIYEFSLFRRPILFFAYDKEQYSVIRGFQSNYDDFAPGKICTTFDELIMAIANKDFEIEKVDRFVKDNFDYLDTGSTDRVIDQLILNTPKKKNIRCAI